MPAPRLLLYYGYDRILLSFTYAQIISLILAFPIKCLLLVFWYESLYSMHEILVTNAKLSGQIQPFSKLPNFGRRIT